ncbi:exodeoxyribonuclease VII large subunit [Ottowia sp. SB7-C50]|uniref:exodeoxyribonuclease VII large subunit n=1 Tax=Ottowia sp. SB7-C50 TaxID=3081231 RepID=UPI0029559711|nr:exodeoxyribonuclease VII large subunit [Ottowia sp. SB7-C50]WOP14825.1 exodeoxyribonuclease VII large subunit [Ottowia sp. SB7-C50]
MNTGFGVTSPALAPRIWAVGALTRAVADSLDARFNPVAVRGEVSGFTRAASGHCYFTLKDDRGQLRSAMFRRAAGLLGFAPRDGDQVEVRGRLTVYEPRGDLQLVVESMQRAGQGALFEQFLRLKARLEAEGLFDPERRRPLPAMPRGIGLVTSLGAAALHDVLSALARRVPHIPVVLAPAAVQGADAPVELCAALQKLYRLAQVQSAPGAEKTLHAAAPPIDLILLVRGGGSIEDLWAFNDEQLARTIVASPVPVVSGVGHETDFTIADFAADLRAPTPTAAAELVSAPRDQWLAGVDAQHARLATALRRRLDAEAQRLDWVAARLGRPSQAVAGQQRRLDRLQARLDHAQALRWERERARLARLAERLPRCLPAPLAARRTRLDQLAQRLTAAVEDRLAGATGQLDRAAWRLGALDPQRVLERGYAWLQDEAGCPVTRAAQASPGDALTATLADGQVDLTVAARRSA